jgi:dihydroorotate dehydrogenase
VIGVFERLARPLLQLLDAETAHSLAIQGLKIVPPRAAPADDSRLRVRAFGLDFPNPVGIAPGFDKHGEVPDALLGLGFGFVEIGTVTPLPQPGNPRPRIFRLEADGGVINRLGFNSDGEAVVLERLRKRSGRGVVGVNIGANKESPDRTADYSRLIETMAPVADYITVNVSSPNTPGLRSMQQGSVLDDLLARVVATRDRVAEKAGPTPLLLKIAPDLSLSDLDDVVSVARLRRIDGMIVGNTTIGRPPSLRDRNAKESGGLSGKPLFHLSTRMLAETCIRAEGAFPLIGAGGINSGAAALRKIKAGASLVQLYSALVYRGLGLVGEIKSEFVNTLARGPAKSLSELVGVDARSIVAEPWPT